jgi:hypothetical protein
MHHHRALPRQPPILQVPTILVLWWPCVIWQVTCPAFHTTSMTNSSSMWHLRGHPLSCICFVSLFINISILIMLVVAFHNIMKMFSIPLLYSKISHCCILQVRFRSDGIFCEFSKVNHLKLGEGFKYTTFGYTVLSAVIQSKTLFLILLLIFLDLLMIFW